MFRNKKHCKKATTEAEKKKVQVVIDAKRAVWKAIPQMNSVVKSMKDLSSPEVLERIKSIACEEIIKQAKTDTPLFADEEAKPLLEEVNSMVDVFVKEFIDNIIEIPRMTIQKEAYKTGFQWFDLNVSSGFDLPALNEEIIRISLGAGEKSVDVLQVIPGRKFDSPVNQIVGILIDHDEIDYDENSELLYHLARQAVDAVTSHLEKKEDLPKVVNQFKAAIGENIFKQMMQHFVMIPIGFFETQSLAFYRIAKATF